MVDNLIKLFDSFDTDFSSSGICYLSDAISCNVIEERNGSFELSMEYPINGARYSEIKNNRIIFCKPNAKDNPQPFRIYQITKNLSGTISVEAAHISYDLSGYPVSPYSAHGCAMAMQGFIDNCPVIHPFTFFTDKDTESEFTVSKPSSIRSLLGGQTGSLLDTFKGEYKFDCFKVSLLKNRGSAFPVKIAYGKNITDFQQEENLSNLYTAVYPFWYRDANSVEQETDKILITLPEKIVKVEGNFERVKVLSLDLTDKFSEPPSIDELRSAAEKYIKDNNIGVPKVSIKLSHIPVDNISENGINYDINDIGLCDTVTIDFSIFDIQVDSECIKTDYNVINGKYNSIELGDSRSSISDSIAEREEEVNNSILGIKTAYEQGIEKATKMITGNSGGYVVLHNSYGRTEPDEILIMDQPSINLAKKVWRWNKNGLGFSSNGYEGPFDALALTADGQINADLITAGELNGAIIKGGSVPTNKVAAQLVKSLSDGSDVSVELADMIDDSVNKYGLWFMFEESGGLTIGSNRTTDKKRVLINITNNRISFRDYTDDQEYEQEEEETEFDVYNNEVTYLSDQNLHVTNAEILNMLKMGKKENPKFAFIPRRNGSLSFKYLGGTADA